MGIRVFHVDSARGIMESLGSAGFRNDRSIVERIPIGWSRGYSSQRGCLTDLLSSGLRIVEEVPSVRYEGPNFRKIRSVIFGKCDGHEHFMNLVRIRGQKPDGTLSGQ